MDIKIEVNFGGATLTAINNLASALTGGNQPPGNPLKSVPAGNPGVTEKPAVAEKSDKAEAAETTKAQTADARITVEAIRQLVSSKAADAAGKAKVKEILGEFGAANVSTLSPENYGAFYTRVQAI